MQSLARQDMSVVELLGLVAVPALYCWHRQVLQVRLRSFQGLADYFAWQEANGREGLADMHKRIVVAQSDLRVLRQHRAGSALALSATSRGRRHTPSRAAGS